MITLRRVFILIGTICISLAFLQVLFDNTKFPLYVVQPQPKWHSVSIKVNVEEEVLQGTICNVSRMIPWELDAASYGGSK
jgi:hypothetical protein